jgi:uncharacterized membrane protein
MSTWGVAAAALGLAAYSLLSWGLMARAPDRAWTVLALFGPLLLALTLAGAQRRHAPTLVGCAALAVLLVAVWWRGGVDVNRLYVLQHAAIHAVLGWGFAITLRAGATPLITALAERVHAAPLTPAMRAYTRRVTRFWVFFFAGMIALSLLLYALAPWGWWSFFCTVLTPLAAVAAFVAEFAWRRWRHPDFEAVSMRSALQAWREHDRRPT